MHWELPNRHTKLAVKRPPANHIAFSNLSLGPTLPHEQAAKGPRTFEEQCKRERDQTNRWTDLSEDLWAHVFC